MARVQRVQFGNVTLYHGDCRTVLPRLTTEVDIVVTSPPYNQLFRFDKRTRSTAYSSNPWHKGCGYSDNLPEPTYQKFLLQVFDLCRKKTKGLMWINHKMRYRNGEAIHPARMFPYPIHTEIIWDRSTGQTFNHSRFVLSHEVIYGFGKPHYWNEMYDARFTVWRIAAEQHRPHPCPYPEALVTPIVIASCPRDGVVLDPFMGIGTTGVAAVKHHRKFIGIEKEKTYFKRAIAAIERAHKATLPEDELKVAVLEFIQKSRRPVEVSKEFNLDHRKVWNMLHLFCSHKLAKQLSDGRYISKKQK